MNTRPTGGSSFGVVGYRFRNPAGKTNGQDSRFGETDLTLTDPAEATLLESKAIVDVTGEEDTDTIYRLANFDEMFGYAGAPIRAPENLPAIFETLALLAEAEGGGD